MIVSADQIRAAAEPERPKKRGDRHNETIRTLAEHLRDEGEHIERTLQQLVDIVSDARPGGTADAFETAHEIADHVRRLDV